MKLKRLLACILAIVMIFTMAACGQAQNTQTETTAETTDVTETATEPADEVVSTIGGVYENSVIDTADMFTERDLTQTANLTAATYYTVTDGQDIEIT
ncbi:MAG: hypothetical protein IJT40_00340, partial [Firmicutes bacterium]|nr:hypothetical protein [Bacillota bacterium]